MKRALLMVTAAGLMLAVSGLALQGQRGFPLLDWAHKAAAGPDRVALLIELGLKDYSGRDWSGRATVTGAKVAGRAGYRFRRDDRLVGTDGWEAASHTALRAPKGNPAVSKREPIATVGVVLHLENVGADATLNIETKKGEKATIALRDVLAGKARPLWNGAAIVRLVSSAAPVADGPTEDDFPAAAYGPDGTLWVAYISYTLRHKNRRIEQPRLKAMPKDFAFLDTPGYADQLWLRSFKGGKGGKAIAITGPREDLVRCAVGVTGAGEVWVAYSAHRDGNFDIYARQVSATGKLGAEQRLTHNPGPDLTPVLCTDAKGDLWLAFQSWGAQGRAAIALMHHHGAEWRERARVPGRQGENCWHAALAASPDGKIALAHDVYRNGSYDVQVVIVDPAKEPLGTRTHVPAGSAKFEARPALVYDRSGRLWLAYEEGPPRWGKDYGALVPGKGNPLYNERSVRVLCLNTRQQWLRPTAELPTSRYEPPSLPFDALKTAKYETAPRYASPRLGLDGQGRVWLATRRNFGSRYTTHPGSYWLTFLRRLDGDRWSEPIEVHHSDGMFDQRAALLPHPGGGLVVVHNTDGRMTTPETIDNQVHVSTLSLPGGGGEPKLVEHLVKLVDGPAQDTIDEYEAVQRLRKHRIKADGRTYQYLRGEYHRHTEISWDGAPDGSLEDMFRYALDAARFDWIGNADHDNGAGREYTWWLTQKFSDAYHVPGTFTPMFTYERSVAYPHGHRNVMFARRGVMTLPRLAAPPGKKKPPGGVHPDDTKMLYRYLREFGGICGIHTSATGMGTDWRDNDPVVEPIVEIYQGDRMSYEMPEAPRAGHDPQTGVLPANVAGWYPKGFINNALKKGYKLGFQSSSDHWSTHVSYFIVLAEKAERASILDAVKKRRCYGATDNILVDFRSGDHLMGSEQTVAAAPTFSVFVHGTDALEKVEMLRDSEVVGKLPIKGPQCKTNWIDPNPRPGTHYYYIRALQRNGEIAWASPIWITLKR